MLEASADMHEVFETTAPTAAAGADAEESGFFDAPLLAELEDLARAAGARVAGEAGSGALPDKLAAFLRGPSEAAPLDEDAFTSLPATELTERTNALLEICRGSALHEPLQAVENFVVFFRALLPTLSEGGSDAVKRATSAARAARRCARWSTCCSRSRTCAWRRSRASWC
jgi:hypothetical protein